MVAPRTSVSGNPLRRDSRIIMTIAAYLTPRQIDVVTQVLGRANLFRARSWEDLDWRLGNAGATLALIDPAADGSMNVCAAIRILTCHGSTPVVAYVTLTYENLSAVARLSRHGLAGVLLSPQEDDGAELHKLLKRFTGDRVAHGFLALVEARLRGLEPRLFVAVQDVFERPERYKTATDIARESNLSTKHLYRAFKKAQLGTPRKLLTAAKVLRGFAYLQERTEPIHCVCTKLGYSGTRAFSIQVRKIFGCSPSDLRRVPKSRHILEYVFEWLYKPPGQVLRRFRAPEACCSSLGA